LTLLFNRLFVAFSVAEAVISIRAELAAEKGLDGWWAREKDPSGLEEAAGVKLAELGLQVFVRVRS
jgi:hypothetical protein